MTDKKITTEIIKEIDNYSNKLGTKDLTITNIAELFILKIHKGLSLVNEATPKSLIIKEAKENILDKIETNDSTEFNMYNPPVKEQTCNTFAWYLFRGLQYAIKTWNNIDIEYVLQNLGIEDAQTVITSINEIENNTNNIKDRDESIYQLVEDILSTDKSNKLSELFLWILLDYQRAMIIDICKNTDQKKILYLLKIAKHIGKKYHSVYKERIAFYYFYWRKIRHDINLTADFISQIKYDDILKEYDLNSMAEGIKGKKNKNFIDFCNSFGVEASLILDLYFLAYHFIYEHPQYTIKFGFTLMSNTFSPQIQEALFTSFTNKNYCALIQYEYEWWSHETGKTLSLPYQFYDKALDLRNFNILDYNLYDRKSLSDIKTKSSKDSSINIFERISHNLDPYYVIFDKDASTEKGSVLKKKYLCDLITYAENIKDSYSVYGFAYLLYKSQYLNWRNLKFDNAFVYTIAQIFEIEDKLTKIYPESKAKKKAWEILDKSPSLKEILEDGERDKLRPIKCYI